METNILYYGDNLIVLPRFIPDESIDLVYLDPPFGTGKKRAAPSRLLQEGGDVAYDVAYDDSYCWGEQAQSEFQELCALDGEISGAILGLSAILGRSPSLAYIVSIARRLRELRRVLKQTGSIYLHCDYRHNTYLRIVLDSIFGRENFRSEIVWHYTGGGRSRRYFSRKHDTILFYTKSSEYTFNLDAVRVPYAPTSGYAKSGIVSRAGKKYLPHPDGTPVDDVWEIPIVNPMSHERVSYPTQKPETLLSRVVLASSNPGEIVLDPFCGCGTTLVVAGRLGRRWAGIDSNREAIDVSRQRLAESGCNRVRVITPFPASYQVAVKLSSNKRITNTIGHVFAASGGVGWK